MKLNMNIRKPLHDYLPTEWSYELNTKDLDYMPFRNLQHFKQYVSTITQKQDNNCGVSYKKALEDLIKEKSQFSQQEYESIRDLVRANLHKQGLISEDIYESFKYSSNGHIVDIAKVVLEDPECFLTPVKSYTNHFYELYVSISYPYHVSDDTVRKNAIKLLATIEELERQHIYIKVTLVFADRKPNNENDMLMTIPLFSHKDFKSIETMSAVLNERLLRKFCFAMLEDVYGNTLTPGYGNATNLHTALNLGNTLDEIKIFTDILDKVITPGVR